MLYLIGRPVQNQFDMKMVNGIFFGFSNIKTGTEFVSKSIRRRRKQIT
jgi:hypothetical protein